MLSRLTTLVKAPRWKGSLVSSAVRGYSRKIHDIRVPIYVEITHNAQHRPTPPRAAIVHAVYALPGVINEFSVLHMARPNASTTQINAEKVRDIQ